MRREQIKRNKVTLFSNFLLSKKKLNKLFVISSPKGYYDRIQSLLLKLTS